MDSTGTSVDLDFLIQNIMDNGHLFGRHRLSPSCPQDADQIMRGFVMALTHYKKVAKVHGRLHVQTIWEQQELLNGLKMAV